MADDQTMNRYRKLYASLLRLYPKCFRDRFAEGMEQTFSDLCQERRAAGIGYRAFALGLYGETFAAMLRERAAADMPPRKKIFRVLLITLCILTVPMVGMRLSDEVNWSLMDFVAAGMLFFGTGFAFELLSRRSGDVTYRLATGLACITTLLLVWINLAVGIVGPIDNPANLLYLGVLVVGALGAGFSRLRPQGMAFALFAMAAVHALVTVLAIIMSKPVVAGANSITSLIFVLFLNTIFVLLFVASAALFRRAEQTQPKFA